MLTLVGSARCRTCRPSGIPVLTPPVDIAERAHHVRESGAVANVTASRVSRERMRKLRIFQRSGYLSLDLAAGTASSIRLRRDVDLAALAQQPRALEAFVERIPLEAPEGEPLRLELAAVRRCASRAAAPVAVTGEDGREALAVALRIVAEIERYDAAALVRAGAGASAVREILFVAGEASGDLHAARLAAGAAGGCVRTCALVGVGGERMRAAGVELLEDASEWRSIGFVEVLRHIPQHWALLRRLKARHGGGHVGLVVCIDYPGFNMRVAEAARAPRACRCSTTSRRRCGRGGRSVCRSWRG